MGKGKKRHFFHFLNFFHFYPKDKENNFFFVKNTTKSCNIFLHFHFLELKSTFPIFRFLHSISTPKNKKMNKKSVKNSLFFTILECPYNGKKYVYFLALIWASPKIILTNKEINPTKYLLSESNVETCYTKQWLRLS